MANIPRYTDKDFNNEGHEVDFNLRKVFDMPNIEVSFILFLTVYILSANDILLRQLRQMPSTNHQL